eukprot:scaffold1954_cov268-Pinguiococcus_pyrenoidosus.AAC.299
MKLGLVLGVLATLLALDSTAAFRRRWARVVPPGNMISRQHEPSVGYSAGLQRNGALYMAKKSGGKKQGPQAREKPEKKQKDDVIEVEGRVSRSRRGR